MQWSCVIATSTVSCRIQGHWGGPQPAQELSGKNISAEIRMQIKLKSFDTFVINTPNKNHAVLKTSEQFAILKCHN